MALLPVTYLQDEINENKLQVVLPEYKSTNEKVFAYYLHAQQDSNIIKLTIQFIRDFIKSDSSLTVIQQ